MKTIKKVITLVTLSAFLCGLQGCATNPQQEMTYSKRDNRYHNPQKPPDTYTAKHHSAANESPSYSTAQVLGVGTGVTIGLAALTAMFIVSLPYAFAAGIV